MENTTCYIGIDPGKSGFITVLSEDYGDDFYPMPTHKVGTGKLSKTGKPVTKTEFHEAGLFDIIMAIHNKYMHFEKFGIVEDVIGRQGWSAQNNFNFGHTAGLQTMMLHVLKAEVIKIRPQRWQAVMFDGYEKVKVPSSTGKTMVHDAKATALSVVMNEYPSIDWRKSERAKTPDDNKIDSFLMAKFLIKYLNH